MTAKEAIEKSIQGQKSLFERIVKKIESEADYGSRGAVFWTGMKNKEMDEKPCEEIKNKLIELGYDVKIFWSVGNDEYRLTINW